MSRESTRTDTVLSLVERGWRAARDAESVLRPHGRVMHLVKGRVVRSLRSLMGLTHPVRIVGAPRPIFWPCAWLWLLGLWVFGRAPTVWVDNARSHRRVARWAGPLGVKVILLDAPRPPV